MQEIHALGGGGGGARFYGAGDRRIRPHHNIQHQQALKCPRCDSLNTKFCYYNNYNLSQPRHFCKSCRRYWTKGGVLRNVPVGGSFRKNKRGGNQKTSGGGGGGGGKERTTAKAQSSSSTKSSSLTIAATTITTPTEQSDSAATVFNYSDSQLIANSSLVSDSVSDFRIFRTEIGCLESLIPQSLGFGVIQSETTSFSVPTLEKAFDIPGIKGVMDDGGHMTAEWGNGGGGGVDTGLFDLTAAVDPYWSHPQWTDADPPSLNFLS